MICSSRPRVIGIVNMTEDSFSDGGRYLAPRSALSHARQLHDDGADIIELGAVASHPGARPVSAAEEQRRLAPVLDQLVADGIPVSVDSFNAQTQRFAVARGAGFLNDIQGFPDPAQYRFLAGSGCRLIVMHSVQRTGPATRVATDPAVIWDAIGRFFAGRVKDLRAAGISTEQLILDPGLGYFLGSTPGPSLLVLARLRELAARFGIPILICPSRKSFLRAIVEREVSQVGAATLAAEMFAASQGADYIRTHDVASLRDALAVLSALSSQLPLSATGDVNHVIGVNPLSKYLPKWRSAFSDARCSSGAISPHLDLRFICVILVRVRETTRLRVRSWFHSSSC